MAKIGNDNNVIYDEEMSICEYSRKVLWGSVLFLFMCTVLTAVGGFLAVGAYEIVGALFGFAELDKPAYALIGTVAFISGIIGYVAFHQWAEVKWEKAAERLLKKENKSFVSQTYKSYKEKVCFSVKFDD
jgi:uncharacterized membrane protein YuzA (DUF378 family)